MRVDAAGLHWGPASVDVLHDVTVTIEHGRTVGVVGPNGSGKSSLLRLLAGLRRPGSGSVHYDTKDVTTLPSRERARRVAFVDQASRSTTDLTIEDVVWLGCLPHRRVYRGGHPGARTGVGSGFGGGASAARGTADREAVSEALERTGLTALRGTRWSAVSGGEQQRAHLARALAQRAECLILDEPTNHLDIEHQLELLHLVSSQTGTTNVVALHDLTLAARYCDELIVLQAGRVVAQGTPTTVLTEPLVRQVFRVQLEHAADFSLARLDQPGMA